MKDKERMNLFKIDVNNDNYEDFILNLENRYCQYKKEFSFVEEE